MKRRFLVLMLALICSLPILLSCAEETINLDDFERLVIENSEAESFAQLVYVVIPKECSGELAKRAEDLAGKIREKTSVEATVKYDSQPMAADSDVLEILVGNTSRTVSQETFRAFRDRDYICKYDRGVILIGGKSDAASLLAIDKFESEILPGASRAALMSEHAHFEVWGEYSINSLLLNGFGIYDYTIVYSGDGSESEAAYVLQKYISQRSGYTLDVCRYGYIDDSVVKTIRLYTDESQYDDTAVIESVGNNIEIYAQNSYGISAAVAYFANCLLPENTSGDYEAGVYGKTFVDCNNNTLRIAIASAEHKDGATADLLIGFSETIRAFDGDLICFFPVTEDLVDDIEANCTTDYKFLSSDGDSTPIICSSKLYDKLNTSYKNDALRIELTANDKNVWSVYRADKADDSFIGGIDGFSLLIFNEPAPSNDLLVKIGEIEGEEQRFYVYAGRDTNAMFASERKSYAQGNSYVSFCTVELIAKYHRDFQALKEALE